MFLSAINKIHKSNSIAFFTGGPLNCVEVPTVALTRKVWRPLLYIKDFFYQRRRIMYGLQCFQKGAQNY